MPQQEIAQPEFLIPEEDRGPEEQVMSIIDALTVLARRKAFIVICTSMATVAATIFSLSQRDSYTAEAVILPPQQQQSSISSLLSGMPGGLAAPLASQLGMKDPADIYIGILKSRTVADEIVTRFQLMNVYRCQFLADARNALAMRASFKKWRESLITISVQDHDPKRAAAMANAFVDALYKQNSRLAVTDTSQRRLFFEQELHKEKEALADSEIALKTAQQSTGLVVPQGQAEVLIQSVAQLRAEIASLEVKLQAVRSYATEQNAQVQILQREIAAARGQLAELKNNNGGKTDLELSAASLPGVSLEYLRKLRDLKYHETLFELLAKQYEGARIDEASEAPLLQVVDSAVVPETKSSPARVPLTIGIGIGCFVVSCVYTLAAHYLKRLFGEVEHAHRLSAFRDALRFHV